MKTNKNTGASLTEIKKKLLADHETKSAYDELEAGYDIIRQIIKARIEKNLTQTELAKKIGTRQSNISRLESGHYNPSLTFLRKLALCLGKELHINLI